MNIRLSIIIPFYNVEKYIAQCLDSVYAQDIPESEYEVICVNDSSPDNSREIVLEYQKQHSNLVLVEHEKNKKLGAARNTGLRAARGKYVWFIDSDDYIAENCLNKLLTTSEKNKLEILHFNIYKFRDKDFYPYKYFPKETNVVTGMDYFADSIIPHREKAAETWSQLFLKDFFITNKLFYPEGILFESAAHTDNAFYLAKRFKHITDFIYFYRANEQSIVGTMKKSGLSLADRTRSYVKRLSFAIEHSLSDYKDFCIEKLYKQQIRWILFLPFKERVCFYKRMKIHQKSLQIESVKGHIPYRAYFMYKFPVSVIIVPLPKYQIKIYNRIKKIFKK